MTVVVVVVVVKVVVVVEVVVVVVEVVVVGSGSSRIKKSSLKWVQQFFQIEIEILTLRGQPFDTLINELLKFH